MGMAAFTEYSYCGRTYAFTDPVGRMFECPICQGVVKKAHSVKCCKKTFCEDCLDEALKKSNKCPLCRAENPTAYENDVIDDGVNDFQVLCLHHAKGCEWRGHLLHEPQHREEKCGYEEIECEMWEMGCTVVEEQRYMNKHMAEECKYRKVSCEYCREFQMAWELESHLTFCPKCLVACFRGCHVEGLLRKNVDSHQKVCPEAVVDCPFAEMGCKESQLKRKNIESHTTNAVSHYLALVMKSLGETKQAMEELADAHKVETEHLKARIDQLQVEVDAHKSKAEQGKCVRKLSGCSSTPTVCAQDGHLGGMEERGVLFLELQDSPTLSSTSSEAILPRVKFASKCTLGSRNTNSGLPQPAENPFLSHKSPTTMLNFASPPTNTEPVTNILSAPAVKNSRIAKKAVQRGRK